VTPSESRGALGDRRLAVGGLVLVDDAFARGLVKLATSLASECCRLLGVTSVGGGVESTHGSLERGFDRLVALPSLLVGENALLLLLDVCHK